MWLVTHRYISEAKQSRAEDLSTRTIIPVVERNLAGMNDRWTCQQITTNSHLLTPSLTDSVILLFPFGGGARYLRCVLPLLLSSFLRSCCLFILFFFSFIGSVSAATRSAYNTYVLYIDKYVRRWSHLYIVVWGIRFVSVIVCIIIQIIGENTHKKKARHGSP